MKRSLDEIDRKILQILKGDARTSFIHIAKKVGLSEAAVRRRVKNLLASGAIKRFTVEADVGQVTKAITLVSVNPSVPTSEVSQRLRAIGGVEIVYEVTGEYDIATVMSGQSITEVNRAVEEIRKTKGVSNTNTMIVLNALR